MAAFGGGFNRSLQHRPKSIGRRFKPQGFPGALVSIVTVASCRQRSLAGRLIERQSCSILLVAHARQIIAGINASCPTEEELLKRFESTRAPCVFRYAMQRTAV